MFPLEQMKLTEPQKQRIITYLTEHGFPTRSMCPICGSHEWFVGEHLVVPPIFSPNTGVNIGGPAYPFAMVISKGCGYTLFINAVAIGLVPSTQEQEKEAQRAFEEGFKGTKGGANG